MLKNIFFSILIFFVFENVCSGYTIEQLSYNNETGELVLYPVEDETNLNIRREEMGLGTIEAYMEHFGIEYVKPE